LIEQGFIEPVRIATRSGNVVLLALTEAGRRHAARTGLEPPPPPRDGLEHRYWKSRVATALRAQGYAVRIEHTVPGNGRVDLWATGEDRNLQVEIETGRSDIDANLTKCRGHADRLLVVATNPTAARRCAAAIEKRPRAERALIDLQTWLDYS
jgi:hypothetical protein